MRGRVQARAGSDGRKHPQTWGHSKYVHGVRTRLPHLVMQGWGMRFRLSTWSMGFELQTQLQKKRTWSPLGDPGFPVLDLARDPLFRAAAQEVPGPLLQGNWRIRPLKTLKALHEEGQLMEHCVFSLAREVLEGRCTVYKVLQPERATLAVGSTGSNLTLRDIKLARNASPSPKTRQVVRSWFDKAVAKKLTADHAEVNRVRKKGS